MSIQLMQAGPPPHVVFEQKPVEDRNETIKQGKLVLKDVDYVRIHRSGSKDFVEKIAEEWLNECDRLARESPPQWPPDWAVAFRKAYQQWKAGQEVTPIGFPIKHWPMVTRAQAENLLMARVFSVEELAEASEEVLSNLGLGARGLKDRAKAWLEASKGNVSEELAALRAQNSDLKEALGRQNEKIAELEAAIKSEPPAKRRA